MSELYSVTELAETLGMTPRAIRFYEDKGLIAPQRAGKNRVYTSRDRGRLLLIQRGKRLGFTIQSDVLAHLGAEDTEVQAAG